MWIYEVLPECRNLVTKYKLRVPRCVSWRSAGRIQWSQAKKFIKNAMKPKNRPVGIKPNEVDEEWWISSVEFIDKQQHDTTWSIFPPWFVPGLEQQDFQYSLGNGEHEPYPSIKSCDTVYIPMNIIKTHWFLVEFDLHSKKLRTYDSLTSHAGSDLGQKVDALVDFIEYAFGVWLHLIGYFKDLGFTIFHPSERFEKESVECPQQYSKDGVGDCGPWVCIFMERLIKKELVKPPGEVDTELEAKMFRMHFAKNCYDHILREEDGVGGKSVVDGASQSLMVVSQSFDKQTIFKLWLCLS